MRADHLPCLGPQVHMSGPGVVRTSPARARFSGDPGSYSQATPSPSRSSLLV
jgi:hypothetical protein